ncbi:hypothetical protein CORC01_11190 [Colletotrichum orchidophilum]|uniref:Zinc finger FYVE domain-containing protein n=1 Tax=Colletotrichum orchidophilum TaxID=1209926 RepID=A0A1G4AWJ1_9PEZI|nr:uncharacterized protein CORC01_11190 [Colletotrichum orchidophilum]OHE93504.1 hypothetical protein CORC01_11190 [Colletotrichum orchidophilum]
MSSPDKSLLDRLSALKGGSPGVSLDRSLNALNVSLTGIKPAKSPSRDDALSARLRSLRNTPEREEPPPPQQQTAKVTANSHLGQQCPASPSRGWSRAGPTPPHSQPQQSSRSPAAPAPAAPTAGAGDDVDPLLQTDDQTLEDLLNDEDFGPQHQWRSNPKDESAKVNLLLEELSKASVDPSRSKWRDGPVDGQDDDDDSDSGGMGREVEDLLSQALEEAEYNSRRESIPPIPGDKYGASDDGGQDTSREDHQGGGDGGTGLSLPSVPSTIAVPKADDEAEGGLPDLMLPCVPSSAPKHDAASDFDNDIAARMAALSGLGSSSDGGMGLPSVPTFQPADRFVKQKRLTSKTGYTDEDAATWCTVCLEDGTLQCLGCEDVYCARCWHEMHVGPAAAFDDRTHKAVRFVKPKKDSEKRVMLGAS